MAIILNDNINVEAPKATDNRYGPYANTAVALTSVPAYQRYQGLVVGVLISGSVVEYWFKDGTADGNLVAKAD